mmetsp:Transcript_39498/g.108826  ORF Transcript_39498/g.108826 Transcript_39498/m.108826 type:complete len:280 (-) Transcript_39498:1084-1923(-)
MCTSGSRRPSSGARSCGRSSRPRAVPASGSRASTPNGRTSPPWANGAPTRGMRGVPPWSMHSPRGRSTSPQRQLRRRKQTGLLVRPRRSAWPRRPRRLRRTLEAQRSPASANSIWFIARSARSRLPASWPSRSTTCWRPSSKPRWHATLCMCKRYSASGRTRSATGTCESSGGCKSKGSRCGPKMPTSRSHTGGSWARPGLSSASGRRCGGTCTRRRGGTPMPRRLGRRASFTGARRSPSPSLSLLWASPATCRTRRAGLGRASTRRPLQHTRCATAWT